MKKSTIRFGSGLIALLTLCFITTSASAECAAKNLKIVDKKGELSGQYSVQEHIVAKGGKDCTVGSYPFSPVAPMSFLASGQQSSDVTDWYKAVVNDIYVTMDAGYGPGDDLVHYIDGGKLKFATRGTLRFDSYEIKDVAFGLYDPFNRGMDMWTMGCQGGKQINAHAIECPAIKLGAQQSAVAIQFTYDFPGIDEIKVTFPDNLRVNVR